MAFSPDRRTLATASEASADGTVRLWDVRDPHRPSPLGTLPGYTSTVYSVAFSPDGHTLATASKDTTARLWDVSDPRHPSPLSTINSHIGNVRAVAFSPNGRILAIANESTVRLWKVSDPHRSLSKLSPLPGNTGAVHSVAFSPDGRTLATASYYHVARLWNVSDPTIPACGVPSPATPTPSTRWPSATMGAPWPPAAPTRLRCCGKPTTTESPIRSVASPLLSPKKKSGLYTCQA